MKSFGKYYVEAIVQLLTEWHGLGKAIKELGEMILTGTLIILGVLFRVFLILILPISAIWAALANRATDNWVASIKTKRFTDEDF